MPLLIETCNFTSILRLGTHPKSTLFSLTERLDEEHCGNSLPASCDQTVAKKLGWARARAL